jgi:hypothetical protein
MPNKAKPEITDKMAEAAEYAEKMHPLAKALDPKLREASKYCAVMPKGRRGRRLGLPNKRTLRLAELVARACGDNFDPVVGLCLLAVEESKLIRDPSKIATDEDWQLAGAGGEEGLKAREKILATVTNGKVFLAELLSKAAPYLRAKLKEATITVQDERQSGVLVVPAQTTVEDWEAMT